MKKELFFALKKKYKDSKPVAILNISNKIITAGTFLSYPVLLFFLLFKNKTALPVYILIPALSFSALSVFRKIVNRPRPYEAWNIEPLIPRDKKGNSFPSRHVFSIFLIAMLWYPVCSYIGILLLFAGVILAFIRVITGIHYVSDVIVGCMIGCLCGFLCW